MTKLIIIAWILVMNVFSMGITFREDIRLLPESMEVYEDEAIQTKPEEVKVYIGRFKVYGYDACIRCCGKTDGITKSGTKAEAGRTIAAPSRFDYGTRLYIDGIGERIVEDRGGLGDYVLDVFCNNHNECYAVTGWYDVYIIEGGESQ